MTERHKTWVEMKNGEILTEIPFVAWATRGEGCEVRFDFEAPNPPIHHGDPNLFTRLSFDGIKARFEGWGFKVDHIIRGECSESGTRDCYIYNRTSRVPFAIIRPAVFVREVQS